jgi:hypothetical protein
MSSTLHPPTKTPPLRIRLYWNGPQQTFRAESFAAFQRGYASALAALSEATGISIESYRRGRGNRHAPIKRIGVADRSGERFFTAASQMAVQASSINAAESDPSARITGFESYDLHLAVTQAGEPLDWACTDAALWIMCQKEYLWGRELGRFIDRFVEDTFDKIAEEREEETGDYERRVVKRHQQN